jgi:phage gp29-like protein
MRLVRAQSPDGRVARACNGGFHLTGPLAAKAPNPAPQPKPYPAMDKVQAVSPELARIMRPQAAYRWLLPQVASITPQYIEMVLRGALAGNHVQQWELFDLMLETWPELAGCVQELTDGVMRLKLIFEPFAEEDEDPTPEAIERCKLASSAMRRMTPDATADENDLDGTIMDIIDGWFRGVTCLEIDWQTVTSSVHGTMLAPRSTFWVHPVCFAFDVNGRLGLRVDAQGQMQPLNLAGTSFQPQPAVVGAFPPNKFLIAIHKAKSGTALGGALLRPLAWWWCAANFSADWILNLAQLFGLPFRWASYEPTAAKETVDNICAMLQQMGSSGYAAFPSGTTMELIESGKQGSDHSPQGELLDRADRYARMLILGQTMSGSQDASKGGGKAFGQVEGDVKDQRIAAAGRYVCRVLNTQLIPSILTLNYGDADQSPRCRMLQDEEGDATEAQRDLALAQGGVEIPVSFLRRKYGLPKPAEGEETIGGAMEEEDPDPFGAPDAEDEEEAQAAMARLLTADDDAVRAREIAILAGDGAGHPFRGNQYTGGRGSGARKPPRRIKADEADRILTKGVVETDRFGTEVHFGPRLKSKLESKPEYVARKEMLNWARETVRTGKKTNAVENNELRDYYGKLFHEKGKDKGMMVIVSVKDGQAFNIFRAPRKHLRGKGLSAREGDEPGEQPPVAVLQAIAAASGMPDYFDASSDDAISQAV